MRQGKGGSDAASACGRGERSFDPEVTHAMGVAFEGACWTLGLVDKSDRAAGRLIAEKIIQLAAQGERDPHRIRADVLHAFMLTRAA